MSSTKGIQVVTRERHGTLRWRKAAGFDFARQDAVVPLIARELPRAVPAMPIGFMPEGDGFVPVALLGLRNGESLYVGPDGRWLGAWIPATYSLHPFRLGQDPTGEKILCIDEDSGLVDDTDGEPFFTPAGEPAETLKNVLQTLLKFDNERQSTRRICARLQQHGLIQPWPIEIQISQQSQVQRLEGIYRIDEAALNALGGDALVELRNGGALALAYCQMLSMHQLPQLSRLSEAHRLAKEKSATLSTVVGEGVLADSGTISFDNLS